MPVLGVNTAIIQNDKILLTLRPDFEVWCLPGGGVEGNESLAEAAVRETVEEVGLEVQLTRLVGMYSRSDWLGSSLHVAVFAAEVAGGALRCQAGEALEARYFGPEELPAAMQRCSLSPLGHRQRALDALNGVTGAVWFFETEWPFAPVTTRQELYKLRDESGLSPSEFYLRYVGKVKGGGARLEVSSDQ